MTKVKIGAVEYKNKSAAIRVALKQYKRKSVTEIAKMLSVSPACVSVVNKNAGYIREPRRRNKPEAVVENTQVQNEQEVEA